MSDKIRILRVYEFSGDRKAVEEQVRKSLQGERIVTVYGEGRAHEFLGECTIRVGTVGNYPELLKEERENNV